MAFTLSLVMLKHWWQWKGSERLCFYNIMILILCFIGRQEVLPAGVGQQRDGVQQGLQFQCQCRCNQPSYQGEWSPTQKPLLSVWAAWMSRIMWWSPLSWAQITKSPHHHRCMKTVWPLVYSQTNKKYIHTSSEAATAHSLAVIHLLYTAAK